MTTIAELRKEADHLHAALKQMGTGANIPITVNLQLLRDALAQIPTDAEFLGLNAFFGEFHKASERDRENARAYVERVGLLRKP